ncbi:MAG TPA: ribosome small subunit-dependent GTPase A [Polyangiaceae bacterium]|nr:ribosome small subunit-dependent GTPase A [Polyangiaceae bacterium]
MIQLEFLGYGPFFSAQLELLARPELVAARIGADAQDVFPLVGCDAPFGEVTGKLRQAMEARQSERPVAGDWVAVTLHGDRAAIHAVLGRRTQLQRRAAGSDALAQTVAANVDVYFVVTATGRDLNPRRLERYLTAVWNSGASPVIVLNKTDLVDEIESSTHRIELVAPAVPIIAASAHTGSGVELLREHLGPGITGAFVGSSGVGKSSLVNRLLGEHRQPIASVGVDGRGSHTTTRRELVLLNSGGILIDTPGLREFGVLDTGRGLDITFADIAGFAQGCRFRDCSHTDEPGCAVLEAVAQEALPRERLESYRRLQKEAAAAEARRNPTMANNPKRRWKAVKNSLRQYLKSRDKRED